MTAEGVAQFTQAELDNSVPFDRHRLLKGEQADRALGGLAAEMEAWERRTGRLTNKRRADDARAVLDTWSAVLANLYALGRNAADATRFMAVGFGNRDYPGTGRYVGSRVSKSALVTIRDFLCEAELVDFTPGFLKRDGGFGGEFARNLGRLSRMRARPALLERLEANGVTLASVGAAESQELIILKGRADRGRAKPLMDYGETAETFRWRETLTRVNALLADAEIGLDEAVSVAVGDPSDNEDESPADKAWKAGDRTAKTLQRIFNDGSWERGGRLYGGWWQNVSKAQRRLITINGEPTIELDFRSLHPRILYNRVGLEMPVDPYVLPALAGRMERDLGKVTFMRLLNSTSDKPLKPRAEDKALLPKGWSFKRFLAEFEAYHAPIADQFRTGVGLELQRKDSDIAMTLLNYLAGHRGIVVLPVHDSFIVQRRYRAKLMETMKLAYYGQVGRDDDADIGEV